MKVIPGIDLMNGQVVRLTRGDYQSSVNYGDPWQWANKWVSQGADTLHIVDLDGARTGVITHIKAVERLLALGVKVHFGGGIRTPAQVRDLLDMGIDSVMLSSAFWKEPEAFASFGSRILPALDIKEGRVMVSGWQESSLEMPQALRVLKDMGIKRILFTSVVRDGTGSGPDLETLKPIARAGFRIIVAGGISTIDDLETLSRIPGVQAAVVGKALYEGLIEEVFPCWPKE